ncbi:class I SAM-dependent methyltransferase [uncultured Robinsoniella sp.]|uniref:class I SAM-dependent methyltransferase n=1 Tax=uncultured Robinsoniella sp. TaxID=904190 RepID=UPI00374EB1AE
MIQNTKIDNGRGFDWGRTSSDYAKYRDIYPTEFYQKLIDMDLCVDDQKVLDIGTGTGVLPRNLYRYGAEFTGIDISKNQIEQAILLSQKSNMDIKFQCVPAEKIDFPADSFDVVTACQCFTYFNHEELAPKIYKMLKPNGRFVVLYMAWLPFEDLIAGKSEELILKYNPKWTGCKEVRHAISMPDVYKEYFTLENQDVYDVSVPFNRESWNGRMKSCRGIEASLSEAEVGQFDQEHRKLLEEIAPEEFKILHYAAITTMRKK